MVGSFAKQSGLLMINAINIEGTLVDTLKCSIFAVVFRKIMVTVKTAMLSFRIVPV
jgi:hypothetical protein